MASVQAPRSLRLETMRSSPIGRARRQWMQYMLEVAGFDNQLVRDLVKKYSS